jgi:hypothetical protein
LWLIMLALTVLVIEAAAAAAYRWVVVPSIGFQVWDPDIPAARAAFAASPEPRDEELVWPADPTAPPRDQTGAKFNADFPEPGRACASAYGDSFVWGEDVAPADGWVEQLSRIIGCRIANYGVSGYGTDQAYWRFRKTADEAPVTMLGIFPENLLRNVNQYRALMGWSPQPSSVKGRFILDRAGELAWIPRPHLDSEAVITLHRRPGEVLPHEYLLPDSRDGPITPGLFHTWTLARLALRPGLQQVLMGQPLWAEYYRQTHPSGALPLTVALGEAFAHEAQRRNKRAVVVILPSASTFRARARFGAFEYAPLVAALAARDIDVIDGGTLLLAALAGRDYCMLYAQPRICRGHFGREGGAVVAAAMRDELIRRGLVRATPQGHSK